VVARLKRRTHKTLVNEIDWKVMDTSESASKRMAHR
jgi:hypothetical protein